MPSLTVVLPVKVGTTATVIVPAPAFVRPLPAAPPIVFRIASVSPLATVKVRTAPPRSRFSFSPEVALPTVTVWLLVPATFTLTSPPRVTRRSTPPVAPLSVSPKLPS